MGGKEFIFFKEWEKVAKTSGNTHGLWKLQLQQGEAEAKLSALGALEHELVYLSQLKLLFKWSSIVTYLSYIHKTSSGRAASVKAILEGIRIWTLFHSGIRAKDTGWHLLQYLFHKTAFTPSTLWKSSPRVRARGRTICKTASLHFQRGAYVWHMWFSYFCGHMALEWISFTHSNRVGFFYQCWGWRIRVVDFENRAL